MSQKPSKRSLPFTKMHGLGNDFVFIDFREPALEKLYKKVSPQKGNRKYWQKVCDRHFGVGCDQLVFLLPSETAEACVLFFNADASVSEMCGNGIRAAALYCARNENPAQRRKKSEGERLLRATLKEKVVIFETLAGNKVCEISGKPGHEIIRAKLAPPILGKNFLEKKAENLAAFKGTRTYKMNAAASKKNPFHFYEVNLGNPHAVAIMGRDGNHSLASAKSRDEHFNFQKLHEIGPAIENHPRFVNRTNVEWVRVMSRSLIEVLVWERGAGATLACGTGSAAAAVTAINLGYVHHKVRVKLLGGVLVIEWKGPGSPIYMTGPAAFVFTGTLEV